MWRFIFSGCARGRNFWGVIFFRSWDIQDVLQKKILFLSLKLMEIWFLKVNCQVREAYFNKIRSASPNEMIFEFWKLWQKDIPPIKSFLILKHFYWNELYAKMSGFQFEMSDQAASDESHQFSAESRQCSGENKSTAKRPHDDDHRAPKP